MTLSLFINDRPVSRWAKISQHGGWVALLIYNANDVPESQHSVPADWFKAKIGGSQVHTSGAVYRWAPAPTQRVEVWDFRDYMGHGAGRHVATHENVPADWTPALISERYGIGEHLRVYADRLGCGGPERVVIQQGAT